MWPKKKENYYSESMQEKVKMKKPLIGADGTMFAINWNKIEDDIDLTVWNRLTSNFWLPEAIPVSNDLQSWAKLTEAEQLTTQKVFGGLSLLDSMQAGGAQEISQHALTPHEGAVMRQISHLEDIHAKSYSSIFSTLNSTEEINQIFRWVVEDDYLQKKAQIVQSYYDEGNPLKMRVASVMLESFLFYSGFYWPFYLSAHGKLTNTADIIRLIVRDEGVHGYFIGYKYQQALKEESIEVQAEMATFTHELATELYENEIIYTRNLYDPVGLTEDALHFIRYNLNKAMMNLGYEAPFGANETQVSAAILASLSPDSNENHDFFSGAGSSYVMAEVEELSDDDWDF